MPDSTVDPAAVADLEARNEELVAENKRLLDAAIGSYRLLWQVLHRSTVGGGTKGQIMIFNRKVLIPALSKDFTDLLDQELSRS